MDYPQLTFEKPDLETFKNLGLAFEAMKKGGNMPCILNAANEVAVQAFLQDEIGFLQMSDIIANSMAKVAYIANPSLDEYIQTDKETRRIAEQLIVKC